MTSAKSKPFVSTTGTLTASDTTTYSPPLRGIFCEVGGSAELEFPDETICTITLQAGFVYPFTLRRVRAGTGATLVGFY